MTERWQTFDRMLRDLGAVRAAVETVEETSVATPGAASALRKALDTATNAVHHSLNLDDERALRAAWTAISAAQDQVRKARSVIDAARAQRHAARDTRRRRRP